MSGLSLYVGLAASWGSGTVEGAARARRENPLAPAPCGRRAPYWPVGAGPAAPAHWLLSPGGLAAGRPRAGQGRAFFPGGLGPRVLGGAVSAPPLAAWSEEDGS